MSRGLGTLLVGFFVGSSTIGWGIDRTFWAHLNAVGWLADDVVDEMLRAFRPK
jgi:hypothetical protein